MPRKGQSIRASKVEAAEHREQVLELRRQGLTQAEIGRRLGLDQGQVSRIIQQVSLEHNARADVYIAEIKSGDSDYLEWVCQELSEAWKASKAPLRRARQSSAGGDGEGQTVVEEIAREGNAAFLHGAMAARRERRSIWGAEVLPASQEVASTLSQVTRSLDERKSRYQERRAEQGPPRDSGGDAGNGGGGDGAVSA